MKGLSPFPVTQPAVNAWSTFSSVLPTLDIRRNLELDEVQQKRKLARFRRISGLNDARTHEALRHLAYIYFQQTKYQLAERLYRRRAGLIRNLRGFEHEDTLAAHLDVIELLHAQGMYLQAANIHHLVHQTVLKNFGCETSLALRSSDIMADRLDTFQENEEADKLRRQVLQIRLSTLGLRHAETLSAMKALTASLRHTGKISESGQLIDTVVRLQHETSNISEEERLSNMCGLVRVLQWQCRYREGERLATTLVERSTALLGPNHSRTLKCLLLVARCLSSQGRLEECKGILRKILNAEINMFGELSSRASSTMLRLAHILERTGREEEAVKYLKPVLRYFKEACGVGHRETINHYDELEQCYETLCRYEEAISLYQEKVDQLRSAGDEEYPGTETVRSWTTRLREVLANQEENNR
jgi:tetratricopeptide (TPR) repeat protein